MEKINKIMTAMDSQSGIGYSLIRIFLGLALAIRGWIILTNPDAIFELGVGREHFMWISLVAVIHLLGGILLSLGFYGRLGALMQIPILFSATFFVYGHTKLMMGGQSLELASLVLFLLCIYFVFGVGKISVRDHFQNKND